jgi:hypothetical protein
VCLALSGLSDAQSGAGSIPDRQPPSLADVSHAIELATGYLERACGPDGKFAYEVDIRNGQKSSSYNVIRHEGAIYALALASHVPPDPKAVETMVKAAGFFGGCCAVAAGFGGECDSECMPCSAAK